jgi:GNAT superfamily N-acetyltransferase
MPQCRELDVRDRRQATEVLACQRAGYAVEAELLGFDGIPPLHEALDELMHCGERFLGSYDEEGLAGIVSWERLPDGTVDICRLVVAPRAFRRGHATALLDELDRAEPAGRFTVSTGTANVPALALYRNRGFVPVGIREVAQGVTVTMLERQALRRFAAAVAGPGAPGQAVGRGRLGFVPPRRSRRRRRAGCLQVPRCPPLLSGHPGPQGPAAVSHRSSSALSKRGKDSPVLRPGSAHQGAVRRWRRWRCRRRAVARLVPPGSPAARLFFPPSLPSLVTRTHVVRKNGRGPATFFRE